MKSLWQLNKSKRKNAAGPFPVLWAFQIMKLNYFNLNTTIGHDAHIGSFNVINPGVNISGGVRIEDRVLIGTGSQILEDITIGSDAVIGAGAVVCRNVLSGQTVVGVPARPIQRA